MRVCTLHLAITLGIRLFSRVIIKKYASYCIIACVLTWLSTHILIEKCTQEKNSGAFLAFQGAFPKKQGAFSGSRVHF